MTHSNGRPPLLPWRWLPRKRRFERDSSTWRRCSAPPHPGAPAGAAAILERALSSLREHPDVSERDVAPFVWGCHLCGYLAEGRRPDSCPVCGALAPDFEMFAPFYAQTS